MRHHLLARAAEVLDGRGELRERGLPAARHVVEIEDHRGDARVFLRGLERVDEIPEQGFFACASPCTRASAWSTGLPEQLLDDLALGREHQRGRVRDVRNRSTQGSDDKAEDRQQHHQVQELAQPVEATPDADEDPADHVAEALLKKLDLLFDARGLAGQITQVVQLGATRRCRGA